MPLIQGFSSKAIAANIKRELKHGKKRNQAIAIALSVAKEAKQKAKKK